MTSTKSGLPARNQFLSRVRRLSHHIFCGRIQTVHKRWCSGSTFPKDFPPSSPKVAHYGFSSLSRSSFPELPSGILMNSIFSFVRTLSLGLLALAVASAAPAATETIFTETFSGSYLAGTTSLSSTRRLTPADSPKSGVEGLFRSGTARSRCSGRHPVFRPTPTVLSSSIPPGTASLRRSIRNPSRS